MSDSVRVQIEKINRLYKEQDELYHELAVRFVERLTTNGPKGHSLLRRSATTVSLTRRTGAVPPGSSSNARASSA